MVEPIPRVLSIQSSVVHGYVGNKACMFPLQLLGFDVSPINTVQLSNHTGYKSWTGHQFPGAHLEQLIKGLKDNNVLTFDYILTGYIGTVGFIESLSSLLPELKSNNSVQYICDPVMGDGGKLYVPSEFVGIYRDKILPFADIVLPNQTEAELLTGLSIKCSADASRACRILHEIGPKIVIITSLHFPSNENIIEIFASSKTDGQHRFWVDLIPGYYVGTGDLIAALLLAWIHVHPVMQAIPLALSTLRQILRRTQASGNMELCLIQSKADIMNPHDLESVNVEAYSEAK
uniref:pyridoxal kinase n=1 Tax=Spongospora subterranea TaxID=70186 RepID=A0A0H5R756_9EUKA|eukprot:CRZ09587.1 hypothetical protein [Spongospora subterranea]